MSFGGRPSGEQIQSFLAGGARFGGVDQEGQSRFRGQFRIIISQGQVADQVVGVPGSRTVTVDVVGPSGCGTHRNERATRRSGHAVACRGDRVPFRCASSPPPSRSRPRTGPGSATFDAGMGQRGLNLDHRDKRNSRTSPLLSTASTPLRPPPAVGCLPVHPASATSPPAWCTTPTRCCSTRCGNVKACPNATAAWSPSPGPAPVQWPAKTGRAHQAGPEIRNHPGRRRKSACWTSCCLPTRRCSQVQALSWTHQIGLVNAYETRSETPDRNQLRPARCLCDRCRCPAGFHEAGVSRSRALPEPCGSTTPGSSTCAPPVPSSPANPTAAS